MSKIYLLGVSGGLCPPEAGKIVPNGGPNPILPPPFSSGGHGLIAPPWIHHCV